MDEKTLEEIYQSERFDASKIDSGNITEKDKLSTAKQVLFGLSVLYLLTLVAYLIRPIEDENLIDICKTTFPPLATLILVSYFRGKDN